ncbi:Multidrug efflux pump subunit AcrB [Tranquillimonas rosea]|uniref:Multidrug efflux pump subunit AcrB n=1 Tax=Tranquillimonas rosea TaxID=641238 RepID=A0A1H9VSR0_9RHOB|nr:efflux RND transporter permease subunit [Tranquillimonas rosea]SES24581.1 Multidrug efflux pump subunit AcrB [Tranquillimonas rosea]
MQIARASIDKSLLTWILMIGCLLGGIWGFSVIGRLEDPSFTIKQAVVVTQYPGASAAQVAREVSEPLESAVQEMDEIDFVTSSNRPGVSRLDVHIEDTFDGSELPQIWDKLRNQINDTAQAELPSGARAPIVNDSFGDVYGIFFAVTTPGFTDAETHRIASFLRRELLAVEGVADVSLAGLPDERIYVEPDLPILANLGLSPQVIINAIQTSNEVVAAGSVTRRGQDIRIDAPDGSTTTDEIASLTIGVNGEIVELTDLATVSRGRAEDPQQIIRFDGEEAFTLGVSGLSNLNIVDIGHAVDDKLAQLQSEIPIGVELHPIYQQHLVVEEASNSFLKNLAMSVAIVVLVLALFMGWRSAVAVGTTLLLTVVGTVFFMAVFSIEMERISLGALIIAMGMLVDNAIVVAEGMQIEMSRGKSSRDSAQEVAGKTQIPLLGATVIGIMAFAGIGLSPDATGEFLFSLFAVIGISLLLSWVLALTATPLLAHYVFKRGTGDDAQTYGGPIFRTYAAVLRGALKARWLVLVALVGLTVACYWGFGKVEQQFFPDSNTPLFYAHYRMPQGTDIKQTASEMARVEDWLSKREEVVSVSTFVGGGATRFMLTYAPEESLPTYGHLIIRTHNLEEIPGLRADLERFGRSELVSGEFRTERLAFGPGGGSPIAARFSGNDPDVLRRLAEEAEDRLREASDRVQDLRTNWREREIVLKPIYADERAQTAGVSRQDVARALSIATDGERAGTYREDDRLIPIVVRTDAGEEGGEARLIDQVVYSEPAQRFIILEEIVDGFETEVQDTLLRRRNRLPTITVEAGLVGDANAADVFSEVRGTIEAMELPEGYAMEWGGEYEDSSQAQESLGRQLPISLLVMVLISIFLFGRLRQPLIIWLLVPMSVNGVAIGLLGTGLPFSFTALLGLLSLSGMLIKNGIVLVEEIDLTRADGVPFTRAVVEASTSRLRPVVLAAATTILGMIPLLGDAFFASMAVTIMGGLAFATVLTLIAAPVLYYSFFPKARKADKAASAEQGTPQPA